MHQCEVGQDVTKIHFIYLFGSSNSQHSHKPKKIILDVKTMMICNFRA